eukprot:5491198-Prymnesium_polylepis.1
MGPTTTTFPRNDGWLLPGQIPPWQSLRRAARRPRWFKPCRGQTLVHVAGIVCPRFGHAVI